MLILLVNILYILCLTIIWRSCDQYYIYKENKHFNIFKLSLRICFRFELDKSKYIDIVLVVIKVRSDILKPLMLPLL